MAVQAPGQARGPTLYKNFLLLSLFRNFKGTVVCNVTSVQRSVWNHHTQGDGGHHGKLNLKLKKKNLLTFSVG
jgi:hypothetical protein